MGRENKKETVAALHRKKIMDAAETLFAKNGFSQTTIDDISKASEYSRRTIYAYYENKEDILHHIIERGLIVLKSDILEILNVGVDFISQYFEICKAICNYRRNCPCSAQSIDSMRTDRIKECVRSETVEHIFKLGTDINDILSGFFEGGKQAGAVCQDVNSMLSVQILWSGITSLTALADTKAEYILKQFSLTQDEFLEYGFKQLINSLLTERLEYGRTQNADI